jgi:hypothetical protein
VQPSSSHLAQRFQPGVMLPSDCPPVSFEPVNPA